VDDLKAALGTASIGKPVKVSFVRGGKLATVDVVVGERPSERC
jgi:S1-C subfamily serine protease